MAKKKKDSILDTIASAFTGNKKTSSSKKSSSSNKTYKTLNQREAERGQSEAKKVQQKKAQTKKANNNRKNSNKSYQTLNQREASRGQSVSNSYKNKTTSSKSSTSANKAAYNRYQQAHSRKSGGSTFLSENANKSRTEVSRRTNSAGRSANRYAQNNQGTKTTANKTLNQQEAERGMGVVNRYQQKSEETAKQNKLRAEEYKQTNSKLKEEQTNEHKSLLTGAKNTNQQEAMRGLQESKKTEKSMEIADQERKNQKAELEKVVSERKNKIESDTESIKETQKSRKENMAKFNGTTSTQREIEDAQKTKQYQEDKYGKDNANKIMAEQNKREGKMSDLSEASPMSLARRGNKEFAEKQDKIQENKDLKAIKDTTTGTVKQVAGGYLKTLGDVTSKADNFEQTRFLDAQTQKKNVSKEQKDTYRGLRNEINTQTDFTKDGGYYNPVYDTGKKLQDSGDQEVNDALESTKGNKLKNLGLQTYSAIIGNTADRMFGPVWAVSMASRTYGNTIDSTQSQGATKDEDRTNALLQATKEVATEYLFSGFGAAAKLTGTGALFEKSALGKLKNSVLDNVANKVGERFGNVAKNITYSGGKMFLGGTEEAAEELIGGVLDAPISNLSYSNAVDKRTEKSYREQLMGSSSNILDRISNESATTGIDESELRKLYGEQINSADFIDEQSEYFIDAGMDEKSAEKLAENMQKYLSASLSGDKKTAQEYEDLLTNDYMKSASVKQKFSVSDTLEAMTVAYMMTAVTGLGGTVENQYRGAQARAYQNVVLNQDELGTAVQKMANRKFGASNSAQAICNVAMNTEDSKVQARVQAMRDTANNGWELALEQYAELQNIINEQQTKNYDSIQTANNLSMRKASEQGYSIGAQKLRNGTATVLEGDNSYNNAVKVANDLNKTFDSDRQLDETQVADVARAVANTELGNLNVEDIACLSSNMIEERAVYEKATGETLPMVLNADGTINSAETNKATREYLVSKSADNFVTWAKKETERYASETKGKYESRYMNDMGYVGQNVLSSISEKADALSEADYNAEMRQMQRVYEAGKNGTDLTAIKKDIVENYGFSGEDVERMYQAGKMDSSGSGYSVRIEKSGADTNANEYSMRDTHENRKALKAVADSFGVNIVVTDNINGTNDTENSVDNGVVNGYFDYDTNTMYLNNATATRNIGYTLMHELTHNLSQYNTEAFNELVNTFSDMWKQRNPEAYKKWTDAVHDRYSQFGVELTEDQVMEEILCDQMGEILHDEEFLNDLVDEHRSVAELFLDLIKNAIRKLREMFGLGDVFDSRYEEATLSEYNLLKDAEAFLTEAIREKKILDALEGKKAIRKNEVDYSIAETTDGRRVVVVNQEIFDEGSSKADIVKELKKIFKSLGTIQVYGQNIAVNGKTANEVVNSKDTSKLGRFQGVTAHTDKMNVATKMDEVLEASQDYVGEARKHKRKDSIAEFARGKVLVSVDGRSYAAEVITGTYPNGYCMVYDVINFTPESISIKKIIKPSLGIESPVSGEGLWHEDGFVDKNIQNENDSVNKKNGIDHSLDLSTDTENAEVETEFEGTEDRGWDLPEALENQLIADLESSFVEEDSDGDIYVDGEAKKYAEVSLYAKTKTKGGKVKEKSILETEGRELRDVIRDAFVRGTGNSEQTAYMDEETAPEDFGDGTITANMTFYGSWDNVKREIGKGTVYFRDKNTGVNIALPVSAMELNDGSIELFAGLRNNGPDYGNFADHSLEQYLGYPSFVRADENFRLYKDDYLPEDTMSDVADYNIEHGTRPAGMEEYYPRVSPWVEQSNLDIKNELKDAAAGIVEKWKKDDKLTGGRVLDTKKIKPLVNELVDHCVKLPEYYTASERRACRKIAMDALQNVWYEIQNHENPDLDVIYEILYDAADYIVVNSPAFLVEGNLTESDREAYRFFKQHNRSNPFIIQRTVLDPASNKWIHEPTAAAGPYSWYQAAARNGSRIADSIHPTMRELRQATKGMFSVRYARYGEKSNWESELSDYFAMRGFPELAEAASSGRGVVYEGEQINSAGQAVDMLIREARTLFTSASNGRNAIGLELEADYQDDPQQAREWFKKKFAEDALSLLDKDVKWESVADKWKDKYDTMKNQLKAEHKAEVERVKDRKDGDILRLKEKSARLVNREKWKASFKIKDLKAKERAKEEKRKEKEKRKKYTKKINDNYKWFTDRLQKKERALEKNIPEVLRQPLADALAAMDVQSKGFIKAEERNIKKFGTSTKSAQALHVLHSTLESLAKNGEMFSDVNQDMFALNPVISDALEDIKGTCEGKPLRDMTSEELMNVNKLLSAIKHEIVDGNNVILDGRKQEISEVQNSVIKETQRNITRRGKAKTYKDTATGETRELLHKIKSFDFVAPISFFKNIGGTLEQSFYDLVKESENDYIRFTHDDKEFAEKLSKPFKSNGKVRGTYKSQLRKWDKQKTEFTLASNHKIELSTMQIMTMYCESKQKGAIDRMQNEGIYVEGADERSKLQRIKNNTNVFKAGVDRSPGKSIYKVTGEDIAEIISTLTDEQKQFADSLQEYMNTTLRKRGNNASMEMYGVELFNVENYFPIYTMLEGGEIKLMGMSSDIGNIPNPNFTKHRAENAKGALVIGNAMRIFTDYANQMNVYASSLYRVKQFQKICGDKGIRRMLNDAYGNGAHEYIDQMIKDFIGQRQSANTAFTSLLMRGMNTYKRAAISTNLSVLAQQGTAIFRAYMEIGPKYFYGGSVNKTGSMSIPIKKLPLGSVYLKNDKLRAEMYKYCPIAEWKFMGNHQLNFSRRPFQVLCKLKNRYKTY